jgi:tetratricopeptide (TPR) repeat protein
MDSIASWGAKFMKTAKALVLPGSRSKVAQHKQASANLEKGRKFYNQKNFQKAEELFRRAVRLDPEYALAHYYHGLARYKLDKHREAIAAWKKSMEAEPGSDAAYKAEKKISYVKRKIDGVIDQIQNAT